MYELTVRFETREELDEFLDGEPKEAKTPVKAPAKTPAKAVNGAPPKKPKATSEVTLDDLKKIALTAVNHDRDAVKKTLDEFGIKRVGECPPEKVTELHERIVTLAG